MQYCSLQHWTLLLPPDISTAECCFHFGPASSFFLELLVIALCSYPVAYWTASDLGGLIFWFHMFLPFTTIHGVLVARILEWVAILPPVDHVLSELFTLSCLSWLVLHGMAHRFTELRKPLCHDKAVIHEGVFYMRFLIKIYGIFKQYALYKHYSFFLGEYVAIKYKIILGRQIVFLLLQTFF